MARLGDEMKQCYWKKQTAVAHEEWCDICKNDTEICGHRLKCQCQDGYNIH